MDNSSARKTWRLIIGEREFSLFIFTRFIIIFSLFLQTTVVSYLMYKLTKNPLSLGLIGLAEVIPAFGFAFVAGYFVDKRVKRNVYLACVIFYVINSLLVLGITTHYFMQSNTTQTIEWLIYLTMFLSGSIRAFLAPASFSLLPLLVKKDDLPQAITWSSTSWMLGSVLGPLAGGLFMAKIGVTSTISISVFLLLTAVFCMLNIKPKDTLSMKDIGIIEGLKQGFRFVFKTEVILAVLCLDLFAVLFGGAEALLPVFSSEILKVGEVGYGWLRSAHGIGSIILLFVLAYLPLKNNIGMKLLVSVFLFGLCILFFGISTNVYLSFFLLLFAGLFDGVSVVIRHSILQLNTPEELKGRVSSINMMFISSSNELGAFESGFTARLMGAVSAVVFGGVMTMLVVGFTYLKAPSLKKLKL
jgi:MFS family permease